MQKNILQIRTAEAVTIFKKLFLVSNLNYRIDLNSIKGLNRRNKGAILKT